MNAKITDLNNDKMRGNLFRKKGTIISLVIIILTGILIYFFDKADTEEEERSMIETKKIIRSK